jgi:hypothetical protein
MARLFSVTAGTMPTREQFDKCWKVNITAEGHDDFSFDRDPRMSCCSLTQDELWEELLLAKKEYDGQPKSESLYDLDEYSRLHDWISTVLEVLGFEWV